ncbi:MAG: hypothetical protein VB085_04100 [Peptococcaceae bacterium]|nr:hypothetical protein [Peptococcaceae bacterium]
MKRIGGKRRVNLVFFSPDTAAALTLPQEYTQGTVWQDICEATDSFRQAADSFRHAAERGEEAASEVEEKPEILLVNCLNFYRRCPLWKKEPERLLLEQLSELRQAAGQAKIKLLLPTEKNRDPELLIELMGQGFYDFWFTDFLDEVSLARILTESRSFRELEAYLATLPLPEQAEKDTESWLNRGRRWLTEMEGRIRLKGVVKPQGKAWRIKGASCHKTGFDGKTPPLEGAESSREDTKGASQVEAAPAFNQELTPTGRKTGKEGFFKAEGQRKNFLRFFLSGKQENGISSEERENGIVSEERESGIASEEKAFAGLAFSDGFRPAATVLFYSEDDSLLIYAAAILSAFELSRRGIPVLVLELPGSGSRLATALGLRHPRRNLHRLLKDFASGKEIDFADYCFNGPVYAQDPQSFDPPQPAAAYPGSLWFLPDDHTPPQETDRCWERFFSAWLQWALLEKAFPCIFCIGFGPGTFSPEGIKPPGWRLVFAAQPWPGSFNRMIGLHRRWQENGLFLLGEEGKESADRELAGKDLHWLTVPKAVIEEFIRLTAFRRKPGRCSATTAELAAELYRFFTG